MRFSRIAESCGTGLQRLRSFALLAILALGAVVACRPPESPGIGGSIDNNSNNSSFVGQWRGVYQSMTITIVIQPNGQYSQLAQAGTLMTQQSGPYTLVPPSTIVFSVTDWQPKTQQVYHPYPTGGPSNRSPDGNSRNGNQNPNQRDNTPSAGGYYTSEAVAKPPGATDAYIFNGPNTITLTDQMTHGSITMNRVP